MNLQSRFLTYICLICISILPGGCSNNQYNVSQKPIAKAISSESYQVPYAVKYKDGNKNLVFLAVNHENTVTQEGFELAQRVVEDFKPTAIIVEGIDRYISRQAYYEHLRKCASHQFHYCGESAYVASLAKEKHIPIISGEPSDQVIWNTLKNKGVSAQDFISVYLLWKTPQWNQERNNAEDFESYAKAQINHYLHLTKANVRFTYKDFREWYKIQTGKSFIISDIRSDVFYKNGSQLLKNIAQEISQIREEFLSKKIVDELKHYSRVMVVYGENHYDAQKPILEELMGSPIQYITLDSSISRE